MKRGDGIRRLAVLLWLATATSCAAAMGDDDGGGSDARDGAATDAARDASTPDDASAPDASGDDPTDDVPVATDAAPPACLTPTQPCTPGGSESCCVGLSCGTTTLGQVCCGNEGASCNTPDGSDCCGALLCVGGLCTTGTSCLAATQPCSGGGCCSGLTCGTTTLGRVCCGNEGAPCSTPDGSDCCGALLCVSGHCQSATACSTATTHCSGGGCCAGLICGTTSLGEVCCGTSGASCSTPDGSDCCGDLLCVGGHCQSSTSGSCGYLQWWNSAITYGPWRSGLGWDTDLNVANYTAVVLRHASQLESAVIGNAGYMPQFVDQVTGDRFRFFHLHPQQPLATEIGHVYPAGFVVGYSGGGTADTGYPSLSSGPHLCVQTVVAYRDAFPSGVDPCP